MLAFAISWCAQSDSIFKLSLAGLYIYLLWITSGFFFNALSWLHDRLERIPEGWHRVIPASLVLVIAASWLADLRFAIPLALVVLAYYIIWRISTVVLKSSYARERRRELAEMPGFSLEGTRITMASHKAAEQEKTLEELDHVLIATTDQGPFTSDLFLVLLFRNGTEWHIASDNPCYQKFYEALGKSLPLDHEQALLAMSSTTNAIFPLWKRENASNVPSGTFLVLS